ncbi:MAG TPA: GrpB family protein [Kiritimatiellia bacterium]|jgi:GrpB-like predicted nucleotidyltransferase (UPF0157 family)
MSDTTITGLDDGAVRLTSYSPRWPGAYTREVTSLRGALGAWVADVQHIGSTAVPGLEAKPIIDIALATIDLSGVKDRIPALQELGYDYRGEYGLPGREFFTRGKPVKIHLHIVQKDGKHWRAWMLFRDYLREHARARESYAGFKRMLALQHSGKREAYTAAKKPFIDRMLKDAEAWSREL